MQYASLQQSRHEPINKILAIIEILNNHLCLKEPI